MSDPDKIYSDPSTTPGPECIAASIRIRPQMPREIAEGANICITIPDKKTPQVLVDNDKAFTYDHAFDLNSTQKEIYNDCVSKLVNGCFNGFNATVLAYGQTGSGKTFTMGTGFQTQTIDFEEDDETVGIVPRALRHIFETAEGKKLDSNLIKNDEKDQEQNESDAPNNNSKPIFTDFNLEISFMEIYKQQLKDLLLPTQAETDVSDLNIIEDKSKGIVIPGLSMISVHNYTDTMNILRGGALRRTTHATLMNEASSRSHAIFTFYLSCKKKTLKKVIENEDKTENESLYDEHMIKAKFHFVDLAGSERIKKTGATGERLKEGININYGLLVLGNVVSALGDPGRKGSHVPYRDSKLTRILQDSLGGNSRTLMIACISPSDTEFVESVATLKYADRARNIKNKVVQNQDSGSKQLQRLKAKCANLETELNEWRTGKRLLNEEGGESMNDYYHEAKLLKKEVEDLRSKLKSLKSTNDDQKQRLIEQQALDALKGITASQPNDCKDIGEGHGTENGHMTADSLMPGASGDSNLGYEKIVIGYLNQIEDLRSKLVQSNAESERLTKIISGEVRMAGFSPNKSRPATAASLHSSVNADQYTALLCKAKEEIRIARTPVKQISNQDPGSPTAISPSESLTLTMPKTPSNNIVDMIDLSPDLEDDQSESIKDNNNNEILQTILDSNSDTIAAELIDPHLSLMTENIDRKEELVEALEQSLAAQEAMKHDYETQIETLRKQILEKETNKKERIENLKKKMKSTQNSALHQNEIKNIKKECDKQILNFKKKMTDLQKSLKLHEVERNKAKVDKSNLEKMKKEITGMKKQRATLIKQQQIREKASQKQALEMKKKFQSSESQLRKMDARSKKEAIDRERKERALKQSLENKNAEIKRLKNKVSQPVLHFNRAKTTISKQRMMKAKFIEEYKKFQDLNESKHKFQQRLDKLMSERKSLLNKKREKSMELNETLSFDQPADMNTTLSLAFEDDDINIKYGITYVNSKIKEARSQLLDLEEHESTFILANENIEEANFEKHPFISAFSNSKGIVENATFREITFELLRQLIQESENKFQAEFDKNKILEDTEKERKSWDDNKALLDSLIRTQMAGGVGYLGSTSNNSQNKRINMNTPEPSISSESAKLMNVHQNRDEFSPIQSDYQKSDRKKGRRSSKYHIKKSEKLLIENQSSEFSGIVVNGQDKNINFKRGSTFNSIPLPKKNEDKDNGPALSAFSIRRGKSTHRLDETFTVTGSEQQQSATPKRRDRSSSLKREQQKLTLASNNFTDQTEFQSRSSSEVSKGELRSESGASLSNYDSILRIVKNRPNNLSKYKFVMRKNEKNLKSFSINQYPRHRIISRPVFPSQRRFQ